MIVPGELLLQVHEVMVHRIEAPGEQLAEVQTHRGVALQVITSVRHDMKPAGRQRSHRRRVRHPEQRRQIAENGTRFIRLGYGYPVFGHFYRSLDQDVKPTCAVSLFNEQFARRKLLYRVIMKG